MTGGSARAEGLDSAHAVGAEPLPETVDAAFSRVPIFGALSPSEVAALAERAELVTIDQDRVIPRAEKEEEAPAFYFLLRGQVAFGQFTRGTLPEPPKNKKKRITPTMQVCHRVVALFEAGDYFANDHVEYARGSDGERYDLGLFTCLGVMALKLPKADFEAALREHSNLREAVDARAEEAYFRQTLLEGDDRGEILDFYVKQGFEYAHAIKVIQSDKCIDCDECVKACEDRHGISRIERFGPRLGLVQFTLNCRSCEDARCIEVCNFDAIGYDEEAPAPEVIVYDNCVGCTKCAKSCPHEAIRMVDIKDETPPDLVERVKAMEAAASGTKVAKGEERAPKKKKPKRIANKCDHCFGFEDMACITACPTGAIIQVDPNVIFRGGTSLASQASDYMAAAPFEKGLAHLQRLQGVRFMFSLFGLTGLFVLACIWEYGARKWNLELSLVRLLITSIQGPAAGQAVKLGYSAVTGMGRWMGYIGGLMMVASALYTLRLHIPGLRRVGNSRTWFDFHVVFGVAGPLLSLLHTDFEIFGVLDRPLVTGLWWATTAIVVSGVVGRFFYTAIPRLEAGTERERRKLDEGIRDVADQWASMTMSANVLAQFQKAQEKMNARPAEAPGDLGTFGFLISLAQAEWGRLRAEVQLRRQTLGTMKNEQLRRASVKLMSRRSMIERRLQLYGFAKRLLAKWRGVHIALSIVMFVLLVAHVSISIYATGL